jgi:hypothetical protein
VQADGHTVLPGHRTELRNRPLGIKTLSLASDGRVLVVGLGLKTGLVMLLDRDGEVLATNNVAGSVPEMPRSAIFASVFGPTEKAAIFGDSAGGLWRWDQW